MNSEYLSKVASRAAGPIGLIGAVGGFVSDVLQPLGAIAPPVAGLSLLAAIIFGGMTYHESRNKRHDIWDTAYSGGLFISICSVVIFTIWSFVFAAAPERGYLAENIEPIAQLQAQVLNLQEDVTEIKETTAQTQEDVQTIATAQAQGNETLQGVQDTTTNTQEDVQTIATVQAEGNETLQGVQDTTTNTQADVEAIATAQAQGFADIQAAFAQLQTSQTIIENPTTPQEFYSNARLHQLKGNTADAIKAYEGYLKFNLEYVDPIQDYTDLLKATEGISRARAMINQRLGETPGNLSLDLVAAGLLDNGAQRISRYEALTSRAPAYGPAFLALGQEYDRKLGEGGGIRDLTQKLLSTFTTLQELESKQNLLRFYIDKNRGIAAFDEAMARLEFHQNAAANNSLSEPEVLLRFESDGMTPIFLIADAVSEFYMGFDDPATLRNTGTVPSGAGPIANTNNFTPFALPIGDHILYFKYIDKNGAESPIFERAFRMTPLVANIQSLGADFTTGKYSALVDTWIYEGNLDAYWTFYWGWSENQMDNVLPGTNGTVFTLADLEPGDHTVYIRADANDGSKIDTVAFPFTIEP